MLSVSGLIWCVLLLAISRSSAVSYNEPKLCPSALWNTSGITVANRSTIGSGPYGIIVDVNNTIYNIDQTSGRVQVWHENQSTVVRTISSNSSNYSSLFVTTNGDVYVSTGVSNGRVDKWPPNATISVNVMNASGSCFGLFIDKNNALYCSMTSNHQVVRTALNGDKTQLERAAGIGCPGPLPHMLHDPGGIFVDTELNLYIADSGNHRIQLVQPDQLNGRTVAGSKAEMKFELNYPTGVMVDANGYIFIVDNGNHRIVGPGFNKEFRCLVGCSGESGSTSDRLTSPQMMAFDRVGNMFVTDTGNGRIQKFNFVLNSCGESHILESKFQILIVMIVLSKSI